MLTGGIRSTSSVTNCSLPCYAFIAPPPKSSPPIVRHVTWTETEVFAPTKAGKLRRRKGPRGNDENADPASPSDYHEFHNSSHEPDSGDGSGDGMDGGSNGDEGSGGSNWNGGNGNNGGGDGHGEINRWIDGEYVPGDGNLMWAWHTVCGVAFAGSVQHAVDAVLADRKANISADSSTIAAAAVSSTVAAAAGETASAFEMVTAARASMCIASITSAHLLRQQPKLEMSL